MKKERFSQMRVILSHVNTDFDALACMIAAKKLYPDAAVVITDKLAVAVKQFLAIYRDKLDLVSSHQIDWTQVRELILVDVASLAKIGDFADQLSRENLRITVIDHHPPQAGNVLADEATIEPVGAAVSLLIEQIRKRSLPITPFEATLFGLGIYSDTGYFSFPTTTPRDLQAAGFLMEQGMNLEIIRRFSEEVLYEQQKGIMQSLLVNSSEFIIDGLRIVVSTHQQSKFEGGLSTIARKLLETTGADAVIAIVEMQKRVYMVCRASSTRVHFQPLLSEWGGGGHAQAGSANIKHATLAQVYDSVCANLDEIIKPAITARLMMSSPVKTISPHLTMDEASRLMYRYGHTGFPVVEEGKLVGMISRRDVDKANHHGLGHAPVKAYMSTKVVTIEPNTSLEEIQNIMIRHNIGRLPVMENGQIVGIVSRSNVIEILHNQAVKEELQQAAESEADGRSLMISRLRKQLPEPLYALLQDIGAVGSECNTSVYLVGGIVRDLLLNVPNDDVDLVVEGDGIVFACRLAEHIGGEVAPHDEFGTATWDHPSGLRIDVASARQEYYDHPAALPQVEFSTLSGDLSRRDFTINAMAICLNKERFGELIDPFHGRADLKEQHVRVLHNLSFVEDPTRIIRAVRFELRLQFTMDEQTEQLALASSEQLGALSAARIGHELEKLFGEVSVSPARAIRRLEHFRFFSSLGASESDRTPCFSHAEQLERLSAEWEKETPGQLPGWFAYFLLPFYYKNRLAEAKRFALTKKDMRLLKEISELSEMKQTEPWQMAQTGGELHRLCKRFSPGALLFIAAGYEPGRQQELMCHYIRKREAMPVYLTGDDLIRHGLSPGASFSAILLDLEVAVLDEQIQSREQALAWLENLVRR
jgi:tRNA nucleotidyltransferase (CCA-adding enzyme)